MTIYWMVSSKVINAFRMPSKMSAIIADFSIQWVHRHTHRIQSQWIRIYYYRAESKNFNNVWTNCFLPAIICYKRGGRVRFVYDFRNSKLIKVSNTEILFEIHQKCIQYLLNCCQSSGMFEWFSNWTHIHEHTTSKLSSYSYLLSSEQRCFDFRLFGDWFVWRFVNRYCYELQPSSCNNVSADVVQVNNEHFVIDNK